jgi:hypothetical protein
MRVALQLIGILAGLSVLATLVFIINFGSTGLRALMATGTFGVVTALGWLVTFTAGPIAMVQLLRLRNSGRTAAAVLFGYMLTYYLVGLVAFRQPSAPMVPVLLLSTFLRSSLLLSCHPPRNESALRHRIREVTLGGFVEENGRLSKMYFE